MKIQTGFAKLGEDLQQNELGATYEAGYNNLLLSGDHLCQIKIISLPGTIRSPYSNCVQSATEISSAYSRQLKIGPTDR
jgi:hypothetical protein